MSEEKAYKNRTEMEADIWFGGQLDKVTATIEREKRLALDAEMKRMFDDKKKGNHYFPYGEPTCLFCGVFGPAGPEGKDPWKCPELVDGGLLRLFGDEVQKAHEYMGNGVDDARWEPGTTAIDALIKENTELLEDRTELIAARLALSKGIGVEKGHLAPLIEGLYGRIEELTGILKERLAELEELHRAEFARRARLCPHGYEFHAECIECYLKMTARAET